MKNGDKTSGQLIACLEAWEHAHKRVEEELRRSDERFRLLIENASDIITVVSADGTIRYESPPVERVLGYKPEELVGKNVLEFFHPDDVPGAIKGIAKVAQNPGTTRSLEFRFRHKDGSWRVLEAIGKNIVDDSGAVQVVVNSRDITERKRAEEALREAAVRWQDTFDAIENLVVIIDKDFRVVRANQATNKAFAGATVLGAHCYELFHDTEGPIPNCPGCQTFSSGEPTQYELCEQHLGGRWFDVHAYPVKGKDGTVQEIVHDVRDVTERKQAEEERLRHAKRVETLHAVAEAVSQSLELERMLSSALDKVLEVLEQEAGYISFFDVETRTGSVKAHRGLSEEFVCHVVGGVRPEEDVRRWLEHRGPAFGLRRMYSEPALTNVLVAAEKEGLQSFVAVPLWAKDVLYGGLVLVDRSPRRFITEELELLEAVASEIAVGIQNTKLLEKTRELSATDELTGLYNRRHFYEVLETEVYRTQRYGPSFALAMLDLDGFKEYNDHFGHTNGDAVLKAFAQTLKSALRKPDTAFRYGGDEFSIILPATDANRAENLIERVRAKWSRVPKAEHLALETPVGFSAGIAQFPENAETADGLVFLADTALYRSKREGGYKTTLVSDLGALASDVLDRATLDQVYALAATVDARDPYTYSHSKRVAAVSEMIGKAIGLPQNELANIHAASLLHDIGKVGVPDSILTKPGKPTDAEWKLIRKHPAEGAGIVGYVKELAALIPVILHHHERHDGTGYPHGLKGEDIPLGARIISVADAYDTMTTKRQYRDVVSQEEALEELRRCSGTQFDPEVVEALCRAINEAAKAALGTVVQ